jgi:cytochrome P450
VTSSHPPVLDFAADFDHMDPAWVADPYPIWDDLRGRCPIAHSDRYGGVWLPTRHEDISAIAYDTDHFSSRGVIVSELKPIIEAPIGPAPPITSDPPFHSLARRLLLPAFSPRAIAAWEPATRELCRDLLDGLSDADACDAAADYAQHIPPSVIARMLGLPPEDDGVFRDFVHHVIETVDADPETRQAGFARFDDYLDGHIADHVAHPRDDLISYLLGAEIGGAHLSPTHVRGTVVLLLIAGVDTTWSAIGAALWHLGSHADDRRRLVAEPELMDRAVEELLRAYAPVTMARLVARDVDLAGCPMKAGDWVLLPFPAANRDPDFFERADEVVIDRELNRHAAFGLGIHRCLGSNLARLEVRVAIEEWLSRFPDFEVTDQAAVMWASGQVRGPRQVPVRILAPR